MRYLSIFGLTLVILMLPMLSTVAAQDSTEIQLTDSANSVAANEIISDTTQVTGSLYPISDERRQKLFSYSSFNNKWRFASFFIGLGIMAIFLFTGLSAKLRDWAGKIPLRFFAVWVFLILFLILNYIFEFPSHVYRSFIVESDYGFMNQTFFEWLKEDLIGLGLSALMGIIPMWFLYRLISKMKRWWLAFSIGAFPFLVLMVVLIPMYVSPLFNDFVPLEDKQLESELLTLASSVGIEGSDVFQVNSSKQTTKVNAYVTGLFGTERIVLYDNLINNFTYDEIKFVMGHEMGHYVMDHIWYGLSLSIFLIAFSLWLTDRTIHSVIRRFKGRFKFDKLSDIASLPLLLAYLSIVSMLSSPISSSVSRYMEHQSDIFGMEKTEVTGEAAATAFDKLSVLNLSDPDPHPLIEFWFYSHPALKKRMEFVRSVRP
ncbi:MAG: M48 family metallopeptidase [bacterium]|nr:M48 family metallopeptidase [bacterium]